MVTACKAKFILTKNNYTVTALLAYTSVLFVYAVDLVNVLLSGFVKDSLFRITFFVVIYGYFAILF